MKQTGTILSTDNETAEIAIARESACGGNCASCGGCNSVTVVTAINTIGAKVGDKVEMEMASSKVLFTAFIVYALPIIMFVLAYFAGVKISGNDTIGIIIGFLVMALFYAAIIIFSKKNKNKYQLKVEKILN